MNRVLNIACLCILCSFSTWHLRSEHAHALTLEARAQKTWAWLRRMDAAKDLLKRAVELDSAQRYSQALICYEEGIQNLLRAMGGK